jgi:hypothetical protein
MLAKPLFGALLAATIMTTPALAQTDPQSGRPVAEEAARGYVGVPSPAEPAVDAQEKPVTQTLNNAVAANSAATNSATMAASDAAEAQYDSDRAIYMDALIKHDAAVNRTDARYDRQQRAYAHAMAAWRIQVDACKRGNHRACDLPSPNPADFY